MRGSNTTADDQTQILLDRTCLLFFLSLIDRVLKSDLLETVVVGSLAVTGIDAKKQIVWLPADFTPLLSGPITIGQMLVMQ